MTYTYTWASVACNYVQSHVYQFTYCVTECSIGATAVPQDTLIYSTDMHYVSKGTSSKYMIPVSCAARQQAPRLTMSCSVNAASETATTNQNGETCYEVFTLSQSSQRPSCDCLPCVFNEECTQAPHYQAEAQEDCAVLPSFFVVISEDWSVHSDDLMESM